MPRVNDNTSICNRDDWECYEKIKLAIELATNDTFQCNCLPACFEMSYTADVSAAQLGTDGFFLRQKVIRVTNSDFVKYELQFAAFALSLILIQHFFYIVIILYRCKFIMRRVCFDVIPKRNSLDSPSFYVNLWMQFFKDINIWVFHFYL